MTDHTLEDLLEDYLISLVSPSLPLRRHWGTTSNALMFFLDKEIILGNYDSCKSRIELASPSIIARAKGLVHQRVWMDVLNKELINDVTMDERRIADILRKRHDIIQMYHTRLEKEVTSLTLDMVRLRNGYEARVKYNEDRRKALKSGVLRNYFNQGEW